MTDVAVQTASEIETRIKDKMLGQFENSTNLLELMYGLLSGHVTLETELGNLRQALNVDNATGISLDYLGARVGEDRKNRSDTVYRVFIKGRIIANLSRGNSEDVYAVARRVVDSTNTLEIKDYSPAHFHLIVANSSPALVNDMFELIKDAKAAGVGMTGVSHGAAPSGMMTLGAVADYPETNTTTAIGHGEIAGCVSSGWSAYRNLIALNDRLQSWTESAAPDNQNLFGVAHGNGIWVTVGTTDGTDAFIATSADRVTWTEQTNPSAEALYGVAYGGGQFVAVGTSTGTDPYIVTSTDGVVWEARTPTVSKNVNLFGVAYGAGYWVAVGAADGVDAYMLTSTDGVTWTERANPANVLLSAVAYGNSQWCAVGAVSGGDAYMITAVDPTGAWTERANPQNKALYAVAYGNGRWVCGGDAGATSGYLITTTDPTGTWVEIDNPQALAISGVVYGNGAWAAVGSSNGTIGYLITALDATGYWRQHTPPKFPDLNAIAFDGLEFVVAGSSDGVDAHILKTTGI